MFPWLVQTAATTAGKVTRSGGADWDWQLLLHRSAFEFLSGAALQRVLQDEDNVGVAAPKSPKRGN